MSQRPPIPVNLVLIGPPGGGKGTQAIRICRKFSIPHISTGDMLRDAIKADSPLGRQIAAVVASGALASDTLMADLVRERLGQPDAAGGFVLDGFPRTVVQAQLLDEILHRVPLVVALIAAADEEIVQRLGKRRVCDSCRLTQSVSGGSDAQTYPCSYCGGSLVRRADDEPATVRHRLATYAAFAQPVIEFYGARTGFLAIDGAQDPDEVTAALIGGIARARELLAR